MPGKINDSNNAFEDHYLNKRTDYNNREGTFLQEENDRISPKIGLNNYLSKYGERNCLEQCGNDNREHVLNKGNRFVSCEKEFDPKTCKYKFNNDQTNGSDFERLEFNQYRQNGTIEKLESTTEGYTNTFRDERHKVIERNKRYLTKKQLKEIPGPLPYDIYKYREPRKGKICARSFNDFHKPGIKLLPYSTPKFDSTEEMMEYYKSGKSSWLRDKDTSSSAVSKGYVKPGSVKMTAVRPSDEPTGAFLKGMIDFKCHDIVGTLAKMAVIKGDLLDLLAVKVNARAMYDDTYYNVTHHGDKPIGSKTVYFTDLYQPIKGGETTKVVEIGMNGSTSMKDAENMTNEEYHRNMIHGDSYNVEMEDESHNTLVQDRLENGFGRSSEYNSVHADRGYENGFHTDMSSYRTNRSNIDISQGKTDQHSHFNKGRSNSLYTSEHDEFNGYINDSINGSHRNVTVSPSYGYHNSEHSPERYYNSESSFQSCSQEPYSITKSRSSNHYKQRKPERSTSLKSRSQPDFGTSYSNLNQDTVDGLISAQSSTGLPFQSPNMLYSDSNLSGSHGYKYDTTYQDDVTSPYSKPRSRSSYSDKRRSRTKDKYKSKSSSYDIDCLLDTSHSSDSILNYNVPLVSHSDSVLENGYSYSQRSTIYDSCDNLLHKQKPSYGQIMHKYDKGDSYCGSNLGSFTSSSTLSSFTKEDYGTRPVAKTNYTMGGSGLTDNPSALWYPYELESTQSPIQSPVDVTRRISVTSADEMTSLAGKTGGRKKDCKPNFIIRPRRCFADEGGPGKFKASFDGEPAPTVEWLKKGARISSGGKYRIYQQNEFHYLEIDTVDKSDKGEYTCVLTNHLGVAKAGADLEVYAIRKKAEASEQRTPTAKLNITKDSTTTSKPYTTVLRSQTSLQQHETLSAPKTNVSSNVASKIFQDSAAKKGIKKTNEINTGAAVRKEPVVSKSKINYEDLAKKSAARKTLQEGNKSGSAASSVKSGYASRVSAGSSRFSPSKESSVKTTDTSSDTTKSTVKQVSQSSVRLNDREKTPPSSRYGQVQSKIGSWRDNDRSASTTMSVKDDGIKKPVSEVKVSKIETKLNSSEIKLVPELDIRTNGNEDSSITVEINMKKNEDATAEITANKTMYGVSMLSSPNSQTNTASTPTTNRLDRNSNEKRQISSVGVKTSRSGKLGETAAKFEKGNEQDSGFKSRTKYQSPISTRGISSLAGDSRFSSMKSKFEDKSSKTDTSKISVDSKVDDPGLRTRESKTYTMKTSLDSNKVEEKPPLKKLNTIEGKGFTAGIFSEQKNKFENKSKDSDESKLKEVGAIYGHRKTTETKPQLEDVGEMYKPKKTTATNHKSEDMEEMFKPKKTTATNHKSEDMGEMFKPKKTTATNHKSEDMGEMFKPKKTTETKAKFQTHNSDISSFSVEAETPEIDTSMETRKPRQSKFRSLSQKFAEFEENDTTEFSPSRTQARKASLLESRNSQSDLLEEDMASSPQPDSPEDFVDNAFVDNTDISDSFKIGKDTIKDISESTVSKSLSQSSKLSPKKDTPESTPQSSVKSRYQPKTVPDSTPYKSGGMSSSVSSALSKKEDITSRRGARNAPEVASPLTDMEANDGQYVKLKCSFTGTPSPTISWYFNGAIQKDSTEIKQSFDGQWATLKFKDVFPDDTGRYEAVATNRYGEAKTACILTVKEAQPPKLAPAFTRPLQDKEVNDGEMLEFRCEYTGNPEPELTWYHEGKELEACKDFIITFDHGIAVLKIAEVFPEDAGLYELYAKNEKGETKTVANLIVKDTSEDQHGAQKPGSIQEEKPSFIRGLKDMTVYDGQKVTLQVEVSGSLPIEVCWVHGQEEIGPGHGIYQVTSDGVIHRLIIPDILPDDQGTWVCEAYNNFGDVDTSCILTVRGLSEKSSDISSTEMHVRDEMDDEAISRDKGILADRKGAIKNENLFQAPKFIMKPKSVNTDEGNGARFACEVVGNPEPTVTWSRDGKDLPTSGRFKSWHDGWKHFFEITHALVTDAGKYDCQVVNSQGEVNCTITLVVKKLDSPSGISDFRSLLKSRPQLGSRIKSSPSSSESEAEQLDFRGVLTRHVKTKERPQIQEELRDVQVNEGESVVLECKVKGTPAPVITWLMGQKEIKESRYFQMSFADNVAALHIAGVYPEDQGEYTCVATNNSGSVETSCDIVVLETQSPRDQSIELTSNPGGARYQDTESGYTDEVSQPESSGSRYIDDLNQDEPPFIEDLQPENIGVITGDSFQIRAKFIGSEPLEVTWMHGKRQVKSDGRREIDIDGEMSTLTVNDCECSDTGIYTFSLSNSFGTDSVNASVTVEDIPDAPFGKPAMSNVTSSSLTVAWSGPSYDGGCQVTAYRVEISKDSGNQWEVLTSTCEHTSYHISGLENDKEYICRVSAANKHGFSDPGEPSDPVVTVDRRPSELTNGFPVYQSGEFYEDDDFNLTSPLSPMAMISARYQLAFEPRHVDVDPNRNFKDSYDIGEEIGRGRFGNVYKCTEKRTGIRLAAKMIRCKPSQRDEVVREVEIMNMLHHPKLLLLWDAFQEPREMILVMEHVAGGELFERIIDEDYILTERECVHFMRQICEGIRFMHENNILHLDLKPENILCITQNSNEIKIIDFGLARKFDPDSPSKVLFGTPEFVAPEVINYDQIGFETDMWSIGVVCYILISGLSPFLGDNDAETLANVTMASWDFDDEVFDELTSDAKNFITMLLSKNMSKRMQVNRALRHTWLSQDVKYMKAKRISTDKHKRFLARRKWQKTGHAIRALGRMATLQKALSVSRQNSSGSLTSNSSGSSTRSRNGSQASDISFNSGAANNYSSLQNKLNSLSDNVPYQNGSISNSASNSDVDSSSAAETVKSQDINSNEVSKSGRSAISIENTSQDVTSQDMMSQQEVVSHQEEEGDDRKPSFKKEIVDFEAYEGDSARFDVLIDSSDDDLKVIWLKDGEEIAQNRRKYKLEQNKGKCSLIVKTCDLSDDAQYSCQASNKYGSVTCSAELFVEGVFGTTSESTNC